MKFTIMEIFDFIDNAELDDTMLDFLRQHIESRIKKQTGSNPNYDLEIENTRLKNEKNTLEKKNQQMKLYIESAIKFGKETLEIEKRL